MASWITLAHERVRSLEETLARLRANHPVDQAELARLESALTEQRVRLESIGGRHQPGAPAPKSSAPSTQPYTLRDRWLGDIVQDVWYELHEIEVGLQQSNPELDEVLAVARTHAVADLSAKDCKELQDRLADHAAHDPNARRRIAIGVINLAHRASETRHDGERQRRRGIISIAVALLGVALVTVILQVFVKTAFLEHPPESARIPDWALLTLIMFFGSLGGLISAFVSLYVTDKGFRDTLWFDPRPMLTAAKVALGLWTAVIGILAVGSGLLVGTYTTLASALLLAFLFGYGQQAMTGFLDRKVGKLVEEPS